MHKLGIYLMNLLICNNIQLMYNQMKQDFALQISDIISCSNICYKINRVVVYIVNRIIILLRISAKKVMFDI